MLIYADHLIFPSHLPVPMLIYADRHISPFEGGWGDVLFKRCNILKAFTDRHISPSQCSSMLTVASPPLKGAGGMFYLAGGMFLF